MNLDAFFFFFLFFQSTLSEPSYGSPCAGHSVLSSLKSSTKQAVISPTVLSAPPAPAQLEKDASDLPQPAPLLLRC